MSFCLLQVESQVPWMTDVLQLLQETLELAQDLIDKVGFALQHRAWCSGLLGVI